MTMKHLELLVSEIIDYGYSDLMALENSLLKLPLILKAMQNLTNEQRDVVMDSKRVIEYFLNLLKMSGDRDIQILALSILLSIPAVLKFGDWFAIVWFTTTEIRHEFLKLLTFPAEKKMYHHFLDALNFGDRSSDLSCHVYSWKCSSIVKEGCVLSDTTWLNFNLGTRTLSFSLCGKFIRVPFSSIEYQEVGVEKVKGHELLHLTFETDSSSYSFVGLQGETRASMFMKSGFLLQYIENEKKASEENTGEDFLDFKPSLSSLQEFTFRQGDLKHSTPLPNPGIIPGKSSTQSEPSKVSRTRKSLGLSQKKMSGPTCSDRRVKTTTLKKQQDNRPKTSKMSRRKATGMLVVRRRSSRCNLNY